MLRHTEPFAQKPTVPKPTVPKPTPWPDAVAYREAIQSPALVLGDPILAGASVSLTKQGLPLAYTGRFAIVFQLRSGEISWALRGFTSPDTAPGGVSRELRYRLLADRAAKLGDLFVPFRYVPRGIRVGANWFPTLVLRWADGVPLGNWVEKNRNKPERLRALADTLSEALTRLEVVGIAHGDWQHDNILVSGDGACVTLVDYDGVFLPEFAGYESPERGHPNYQHPNRTAARYGVGLDRFPCLAIRTALLALAADPTLWEKLGGDDKILFAAADFADPENSPAFAAVRDTIQKTGDPALAEAVALLVDACAADALDALIPKTDTPPAPLPKPSPKWETPSDPIAPAPSTNRNVSAQITTSSAKSAGIVTHDAWWTEIESTRQIAAPSDFTYLAKLGDPKFQRRDRLVLRLQSLLVITCLVLVCGSRRANLDMAWQLLLTIGSQFFLLPVLTQFWPTSRLNFELHREITRERQRRDALIERMGGTNPPSIDDFVREHLRKIPVSRAHIPGISLANREALKQVGYGDAYEIFVGTRPGGGISPDQWIALQDWARELRTYALSDYRKKYRPTLVPGEAPLETQLAELTQTLDRLAEEQRRFPSTGGYSWFGAVFRAWTTWP